MTMMRKLLSEGELIELLNNELLEHEECENCKIKGIMVLPDGDETGCNWDVPHVSCSGVLGKICEPIANQIIAETKKKYNLG